MNQLALALKDHGMARTLEAERDAWIEATLSWLRRYASHHSVFKTEDFRDACLQAGLDPPHDHHVWGAMTNLACKRKIIRWTGRYVGSESPKTHGHPVKLWEAT